MAKTNQLPDFGKSALIDDAIVQNTSNLKETGFQKNTAIESAQVNTYIKMLVNGLNGYVESIGANVKADMSSDEWIRILKTALESKVKTTQVDVADRLGTTNVGDIGKPIYLQNGVPTKVSNTSLKTSFSDGTRSYNNITYSEVGVTITYNTSRSIIFMLRIPTNDLYVNYITFPILVISSLLNGSTTKSIYLHGSNRVQEFILQVIPNSSTNRAQLKLYYKNLNETTYTAITSTAPQYIIEYYEIY